MELKEEIDNNSVEQADWIVSRSEIERVCFETKSVLKGVHEWPMPTDRKENLEKTIDTIPLLRGQSLVVNLCFYRYNPNQHGYTISIKLQGKCKLKYPKLVFLNIHKEINVFTIIKQVN